MPEQKDGKIVGPLEIWVKYDGEWLFKARRLRIHEDDLSEQMEDGMHEMQRALDKIIRGMTLDKNMHGVKSEKEFVES